MNMKKTLKTLATLAAAFGLAFTVEAKNYQTVFSQDFEDATTYTAQIAGGSCANTLLGTSESSSQLGGTVSQGSRTIYGTSTTSHFFKDYVNKGTLSAVLTIPSDALLGLTDYRVRFKYYFATPTSAKSTDTTGLSIQGGNGPLATFYLCGGGTKDKDTEGIKIYRGGTSETVIGSFTTGSRGTDPASDSKGYWLNVTVLGSVDDGVYMSVENDAGVRICRNVYLGEFDVVEKLFLRTRATGNNTHLGLDDVDVGKAVAPNTYTWTGKANNNSWTTPENWSTGGVDQATCYPQDVDCAVIPDTVVSGDGLSITANVAIAVSNITLATGCGIVVDVSGFEKNIPVKAFAASEYSGAFSLSSSVSLTGIPSGCSAMLDTATDPNALTVTIASDEVYVWSGNGGENTLFTNKDNWSRPNGTAASEAPTGGSTVIFPQTFASGVTVTFTDKESSSGYVFVLNCNVTFASASKTQNKVYPISFAGDGLLSVDNVCLYSLTYQHVPVLNAISVVSGSRFHARGSTAYFDLAKYVTGSKTLQFTGDNSNLNFLHCDLSDFTGTLDNDYNLYFCSDSAIDIAGATVDNVSSMYINPECTVAAVKIGALTGSGTIKNLTSNAKVLEVGALNATNATSVRLTQDTGVGAWTIRKVGTGRQTFTNTAMTNDIELVAGELGLPENVVVGTVSHTGGKFAFAYNENWTIGTATNIMTLTSRETAITNANVVIDNLPASHYFTVDNETDPTQLSVTIYRNVYQWTNGANDKMWTNTVNWIRTDGNPVTDAPTVDDYVYIPANQTIIVPPAQTFGQVDFADTNTTRFALFVEAAGEQGFVRPTDFPTNNVIAAGPFKMTYSEGTGKFTAERIDSLFSWVSADGDWADVTNWHMNDTDLPTKVAPGSTDSVIFKDDADGKTVNVASDAQIDTIYFGNAAVAFSNCKALIVDLTTNLENCVGTMVLTNSIHLRCPSDKDSAYYVNIVVPEGTTTTIDEVTTSNLRHPYVYGSITGRGTLNLENTSGNTYSGPFIYGDMSEFRGIVNVPNYIERNNTQLFDGDGDGWFYASNAVWNVSTSKIDHFLQANVNYSFGALNGTVWQGNYEHCKDYVKAGLIEVGALNVDCSITGGALYETPIRKVGTAKFRCGAGEIGNVEIVSGSYESFNDTQKGYLTFSGGEFIVSTNIAKDINYAGKIKNSHSAIVVDVSDSNRVWTSAIDSSNDAGFTKKGDATLTLEKLPLYSGLTTVADGKLVLPKGTALSGSLHIVDGCKIAFTSDLSGTEEMLLSWTLDMELQEVTIDDFDVPTLASPNVYAFTTNGTTIALNVVRTPASYAFRDDITGGNWSDPENWQLSSAASVYYPSTNDNATIGANVIVTTEVGQVVETLTLTGGGKLAFDLTDIAKHESVTIFEVGEGTIPLTTNNVIFTYATNDYVLAVDTTTDAKKMSATLYDKKSFVWSDAGDDNLFANVTNWVYGTVGGPMAESVPDDTCSVTFPASFDNGITVAMNGDATVKSVTFDCAVTFEGEGGSYRLWPYAVSGSGKVSLRNSGIAAARYHKITIANDIEILPSSASDPWANCSRLSGYNQTYNVTLTGTLTGNGWLKNEGPVFCKGDASGFAGKLSLSSVVKIDADTAFDWSTAYVMLGGNEISLDDACTTNIVKLGSLNDSTGSIKNYTANAMTLELGGRNDTYAAGFARLTAGESSPSEWTVKKVGTGTQELTSPLTNCAVIVEGGILVMPNAALLTGLSIADDCKLTIVCDSSWAVASTNALFTIADATELPVATNKIQIAGTLGNFITEVVDDSLVCSVVVTNNVSEFVWTGNGSDNKWNNVYNWKDMALPPTDETAYFYDDASVLLPSEVKISAIKIADGKALTLTSESGMAYMCGNVTNISGTAKLIMSDVELASNGGMVRIYTDAEVPESKTAYFDIIGNGYGIEFDEGKLRGRGTVVGRSTTDDNTYNGLQLRGDGSEFAGVVKIYGDSKQSRDGHKIAPSASSSNAIWRIYVDNLPKAWNDSARFTSGDGTYYMGAAMIRNLYSTSADVKFEIGALDMDSYFTGADLGSRNDITWIAPTATFTNDVHNVNVLAVTGGGTIVLASENAVPTGRILFSEKGGTLKTKVVDDVKIDPSSKFTNCSAPICFDDEGEDYTWTAAIAGSNKGGFTKKGAGTLTLVEKPQYEGDTVVEAGKLVLTNGTVLVGDLIVSNGAHVAILADALSVGDTVLTWQVDDSVLHVVPDAFENPACMPEGSAFKIVVEDGKAYLRVSSAYTWTGDAQNNLWSDAGNWLAGGVVPSAAPSSGDVAQITNANVTVIVSVNQGFGRLIVAVDTKMCVLPTSGTEKTSVFTLPQLSDGSYFPAERVELGGPYEKEVVDGVVYATRVPSTFTWVGEDGDWATVSNWNVGEYPTAVIPGSDDTAIFPAELESVAVTFTSNDRLVSNVVANADLTVSGAKYLRANCIFGDGLLTLNGAKVMCNSVNLDISNDVCVATGTENELRTSTDKTSTYYRINLLGKLSGDGNITANHSNKQGAGIAFYNDNHAFSGTFETENYNSRDSTYMDSYIASSSNAVWKVHAASNNSTKDIFPSTDDAYKYFGAYIGSVWLGTGTKLEIGHRDDVESTLYAYAHVNYAGHTIRKIGSNVLNLKYNADSNARTKVKTLYLCDGTVRLDYNLIIETVTFEKGGVLAFTDNVIDLSNKIKNSAAAITIDDGGTNATWAAALDGTNTGGFTKKGGGTLTLSKKPLYEGKTTVEAGELVMTNGDYIVLGAMTKIARTNENDYVVLTPDDAHLVVPVTGTTKEETIDVTVSQGWVATNMIGKADAQGKIYTQNTASVALTNATMNANGLPAWQSYALGLEPSVTNSIPYITPQQTTSETKLTLNLAGVNTANSAAAGTTVLYQIEIADTPDGFTGDVSEATSATTYQVDLPKSGVMYYRVNIKFAQPTND